MLTDTFERLMALPDAELGQRFRQVLPYIRDEIDHISASADSRGYYDMGDAQVMDTLKEIGHRLDSDQTLRKIT